MDRRMDRLIDADRSEDKEIDQSDRPDRSDSVCVLANPRCMYLKPWISRVGPLADLIVVMR